MIFEPLTGWLVALLADGIIVANEKSKGRSAHIPQQPEPSHPEPHRDPKTGKIIIENCQLYRKDVQEYGAVQAQTWVKQGKYNLTPEELEKERLRIEKKQLEMYALKGCLSPENKKRLEELRKIVKDESSETKETVEEKSSVDHLFTIDDVFVITGRGIVITGTIKNGTISTNETVIINNKTFVVTGLEQFHKIINTASAGMSVGMMLRGATKDDFKVGDVVYK